MDKKVAIGLCLVGSLVVTLSAPAYANQGGQGPTGNGSNAANTGNVSNPSNTGNGNTGSGSNPVNTGNGSNTGNNSSGTPTVQTPTNNGKKDNEDNAECTFLGFFEALSGQNNKACKEIVAAFRYGMNQGGGGGSPNQAEMVLDRIERMLKQFFEASPNDLYRQNKGLLGLDQFTGQGNPLAGQGNPLAGLLSWLPSQMLGGSQQPFPFGSFDPVGAYLGHSANTARTARDNLNERIREVATEGGRAARETAGQLNKIRQDAEKSSQEAISKLDELSQQDAGGQEAQNELQALRKLIKLTESGNQIKSTGFQTVAKVIEAGNQIDAEGHKTTADLLAKILEAQNWSAQAAAVNAEEARRAREQTERTLRNALSHEWQAPKAALTTVPTGSNVTFKNLF